MLWTVIETAIMAAAVLVAFLFGFKLGVSTERERRLRTYRTKDNVLYLPKRRRGA